MVIPHALSLTARLRSSRHPVIATPVVMARAIGSFYLAGGVSGLTIAWFMPRTNGDPGTFAATATVALVVGIILLLRGDRLPITAFNVLVAAATGLTVAAVHATGDTGLGVAVSSTYMFAACLAFFFSRPWFVAQLSLAAVCCVLGLWGQPAMARWSGLIVAFVVVVVGCVVAWLIRVAGETDIDTLTGLLNRRGFDRLLRAEVDRATRSELPLSLVVIDLDRFSLVNRLGGHAVGDAVLRSVASSLQHGLGPQHALARFDGDEFAVLLTGVEQEEAAALISSVRAALPERPYSAGVATWHQGESASLLVSRVDSAVYRAKKAGGNVTVVERTRRSPVAVELRRAVAEGQVKAHYQPIIDFATGTVVGVEALARWSCRTYPKITPEQFIAVAEQDGFIHELGLSILRQSCADAAAIQQEMTVPLMLNVNVSGRELVDARYPAEVAEVLQRSGWPAAQLVLEVTESVLDADSAHAVSVLEDLRAQGIRIAIDDFGTGYSSLSRLDALPRDFLKLDRTFVSTLEEGRPTPAVMTAIAALSKALGIEVIAEGVENAYQASTLTDLGYTLAQGYYFSRALPVQELVEVLHRQQASGEFATV